MYIYIYTYIYTHLYTHTYVCIRTYTYVLVFAYSYIYVHKYIYSCTCVCIFMYLCIYIHLTQCWLTRDPSFHYRLNELQSQSHSEMQALRSEVQSLTLRCEELSTGIHPLQLTATHCNSLQHTATGC